MATIKLIALQSTQLSIYYSFIKLPHILDAIATIKSIVAKHTYSYPVILSIIIRLVPVHTYIVICCISG